MIIETNIDVLTTPTATTTDLANLATPTIAAGDDLVDANGPNGPKTMIVIVTATVNRLGTGIGIEIGPELKTEIVIMVMMVIIMVIGLIIMIC